MNSLLHYSVNTRAVSALVRISLTDPETNFFSLADRLLPGKWI